MTHLTITQQDFNDLAWMATRYMLGRKTYAVSTLCEILIRRNNHLYPENKDQIAVEINQAIEKGEAGMEMDVIEWQKVLTVLTNKGSK
jgi:hypothetical protein